MRFWILWRGRAVIYKLAQAKQYDELSLGTLLTMEMAQRVLKGTGPMRSRWVAAMVSVRSSGCREGASAGGSASPTHGRGAASALDSNAKPPRPIIACAASGSPRSADRSW